MCGCASDIEIHIPYTSRRSQPRLPTPNLLKLGMLNLPPCAIVETASSTSRAQTATGADTGARRGTPSVGRRPESGQSILDRVIRRPLVI